MPTSLPRVQGFAPVVGADARVLILGSMPGLASLAAGQYYAHPRNQFWDLMQRLYGAGPALPYAARLARLQQQGVALWDVFRSCERRGSLDAAIAVDSAEPNDIIGLLDLHPGIMRVCCNGLAAHAGLRRHAGAALGVLRPRLDCIRLPSSSPAHAGRSFADKLAAWSHALSRA